MGKQFSHKGHEVTVVRRPSRKKPKPENTESPIAKALDMNVIEETPWFSLDELKKRRFE